MDLRNVVFIENKTNSMGMETGPLNYAAKAWNLNPPKPSEPRTKRRNGKVYHYCHHCKYWALHQPGTGKHCGRLEPLSERLHASRNNDSSQSATRFGITKVSSGTLHGGVMKSSATVPWTRGSVITPHYNQPFGSPLLVKTPMLERTSVSGGMGGGGGGHGTSTPLPLDVGASFPPAATATATANGQFPFGVSGESGGGKLFSVTSTLSPFSAAFGFGPAATTGNGLLGVRHDPGYKKTFNGTFVPSPFSDRAGFAPPATVNYQSPFVLSSGSSHGKSITGTPIPSPFSMGNGFVPAATANGHGSFEVSSQDSLGKPFGLPKSDKSSPQMLFGTQENTQKLSQCGLLGSSMKSNQPTSQARGLQPLHSFNTSVWGNATQDVTPHPSFIFGRPLGDAESDRGSFRFGGSPFEWAPPPSSATDRSSVRLPPTSSHRPEQGDTFPLPTSIPLSNAPFSWTQQAFTKEAAAPTLTLLSNGPMPCSFPAVIADAAAAPAETPQEFLAAPSFLYDHYPGQTHVEGSTHCIPYPGPLSALRGNIPPPTPSEALSFQLHALETKRREVARYLAR
jgi:hypothetical protein